MTEEPGAAQCINYGRQSKTLVTMWYGLRGAHYISIGKLSSKTINRDKLIQCDILFFPGGAQVLFETGIDKPYIYLSDTTVHLMLDYYWHNIHPESQQMAKFLEEWASQHAVMNLRSSQ